MEEVLGLLIGVGAVALSPLVPALRPVAKWAVKGGLIVVEVTTLAAGVVGQRLSQAASRNGKAVQPEVHLDQNAPVVLAVTDASASGGAGLENTTEMTADVAPAA